MTITRSEKATSERPIIFSGPMVRAIIEGRKTQTRRVMWPQPVLVNDGRTWDWPKPSPYPPNRKRGISAASWADGLWDPGVGLGHLCPFGAPGDRLWVRETHAFVSRDAERRPITEFNVEYRADTGASAPGGWDKIRDRDDPDRMIWRPSIHMPRYASRLMLEIVSVRVQHVQDISEEDALAEGVESGGPYLVHQEDPKIRVTARMAFHVLWDSINARRGYGWAENPWVWAVEFRRL